MPPLEEGSLSAIVEVEMEEVMADKKILVSVMVHPTEVENWGAQVKHFKLGTSQIKT